MQDSQGGVDLVAVFSSHADSMLLGMCSQQHALNNHTLFDKEHQHLTKRLPAAAQRQQFQALLQATQCLAFDNSVDIGNVMFIASCGLLHAVLVHMSHCALADRRHCICDFMYIC